MGRLFLSLLILNLLPASVVGIGTGVGLCDAPWSQYTRRAPAVDPNDVLSNRDPAEVTTMDGVRELKTLWAEEARQYVLRMRSSAQARADAYEVLANEINRRAMKMNGPKKEDNSFGFTRHSDPSGVELFVGSLGNIFEIRPDGTCWKGKAVSEDAEVPLYLYPDWRPYDQAGNPKPGYFTNRKPLP